MNARAQVSRNRTFAAVLALVVGVLAATDCVAAWKVEENVEPPSYAVTQPASSNLNIDSVVLTCEAAGGDGVLQLQIYLTDDGPLRPNGVTAERLKADPRVEIAVDGKVFPVSILFADEFAVLADGERDHVPLLSDRLLDAMTHGRQMVLRFDLVAERPGQAPTFDGEARVELSAALSAVRCPATPPAVSAASVAFASH